MAQYGIVNLLSAFQKFHPESIINVIEEDSQNLVPLLRSKKCELIFLRESRLDFERNYIKEGIIINSLSVVVGGIIGSLAGRKLDSQFKDKLNLIFSICSMSMGISSIVLMENMPAVTFSMIIGTAIGLWFHLGQRINDGAMVMQRAVSKIIKSDTNKMSEEEFAAVLVTLIVLFCASGTGIYGSIISGMTGDHSILFAKSMLDLFTALIFACNLGIVDSPLWRKSSAYRQHSFGTGQTESDRQWHKCHIFCHQCCGS